MTTRMRMSMMKMLKMRQKQVFMVRRALAVPNWPLWSIDCPCRRCRRFCQHRHQHQHHHQHQRRRQHQHRHQRQPHHRRLLFHSRPSSKSSSKSYYPPPLPRPNFRRAWSPRCVRLRRPTQSRAVGSHCTHCARVWSMPGCSLYCWTMWRRRSKLHCEHCDSKRRRRMRVRAPRRPRL
jgi:hypothetical protein